MQLYLLEEPKGEKYINLMNYAFNKNNTLTFEIIDFDVTDKIENNKIFNSICETINENRKDILAEYVEANKKEEEIIDRIYNKLQLSRNKYRNYSKSRISYIFFITIEKEIYDEKVKNILKELKQDFIKIEPYGVRGNTYCYKISSKVKELLLKENKLYDFSYPKNPENICLLNNDTTWMEIVSHEQMCTIYGDEEDSNYLDKIGIEYETFKDYTVED